MEHILGAHILLQDPLLGTDKEDLEKDRRVEEAFRWPSKELPGCMGSDQCEMQPTSFPLVRGKKSMVWEIQKSGRGSTFRISILHSNTGLFSRAVLRAPRRGSLTSPRLPETLEFGREAGTLQRIPFRF